MRLVRLVGDSDSDGGMELFLIYKWISDLSYYYYMFL